MAALSGSPRLRTRVEEVLARQAASRHESARLLAKRGDIDGAFAKFEEAVTICPSQPGWLVEYARLAVRHKRWQTARAALDRALAQSVDPKWQALRARALVALGHHALAVRDYRDAVALEPARADWLAALGRALAASGEPQDGAALERALELDDANAEWWAALASIRLDLGAAGEAVAACDRALALQAEPGRYALRARAFIALDRADAAVADLRRALALDPTRVAWWEHLARLLAGADRASEAIEAYRAALALDDRQARVHASLGRLLARRGEIGAAIEHLGRAVELNGDQPDWRADLHELRELVASGRSAGGPPAGKDAGWYDTIYQHSEKYHLGYEDSAYWPVWQRIIDMLAGFGAPAIIEIGCGPGQLAAAIRDRIAPRAYLGIDFSATAIDMARANAPELAFTVGDAFEAREVDEFAYDVVICTEVLEHIERDRDVIRRWRPGAGVIATVPNYHSASHVRYFRDADEVRARYERLIDDLAVEPIAIERDACLYLMSGRVADRA